MQAEYREQKRAPYRVGTVEEVAFHRRQINSEQPDLQESHRQRTAIAAFLRALEIAQRLDHKHHDQKHEARQAHTERRVEITIMAVRGKGRPFLALREALDRAAAPERSETIPGHQFRLQRLQ